MPPGTSSLVAPARCEPSGERACPAVPVEPPGCCAAPFVAGPRPLSIRRTAVTSTAAPSSSRAPPRSQYMTIQVSFSTQGPFPSRAPTARCGLGLTRPGSNVRETLCSYRPPAIYDHTSHVSRDEPAHRRAGRPSARFRCHRSAGRHCAHRAPDRSDASIRRRDIAHEATSARLAEALLRQPQSAEPAA